MRICKTKENGHLYRVVALILALLLALGGAALAENVGYDIDYSSVWNLFTREDCESALNRAGREPVIEEYGSSADLYGYQFTVAGDRAYFLSVSGLVYSYDLHTGAYEFLTELPAEPRRDWKDLSKAGKKALQNSVGQIIGAVDSDVLYGYCPSSGLFGTIDQDGIHWNDVQLDNYLSMKYVNANPEKLGTPFVEGNMLYACYKPFFEDDPDVAPIYRGHIWEYDITTGECTLTKIEEMYAFTPYKSGQALLLRRANDGHMYLSIYDLQAREIVQEEFMALPVSAEKNNSYSVANVVGGIAYHESSDSIVYMGAEGPCQSVAGGEFHLIPLEGLDYVLEWLMLRQSWILEDGTYLYAGGISNFMIQ